MRSKHKINYADSDKFKAEYTKYSSFVLATPFCWDTLHLLADGQAFNPWNLFFETVLLGVAIFLLFHSVHWDLRDVLK